MHLDHFFEYLLTEKKPADVGDINCQSAIKEKYEVHRYITFIYTKVEFQDAYMLLYSLLRIGQVSA